MPPLQPDTHTRGDAAVAGAAHPGSGEPAAGTPTTPSATEVVEARTAEEAVAEVHRRLGPDARIVAAEKVLRGGIGGFFARELVQLTVELPSAASPTGDVRVIPSRSAISADDTTVPARAAATAAASVAPGPAVTSAGSAAVGEQPRRDAATNPLRAALEAGVDDGPPGETFGELLDRRAAARRDDLVGPSGAATTGVGGGVHADGRASTAVRAGARPDVIERLTRETDARERTFGEVLRSTMLGDLPSTPGDDAPAAPVPVTGPSPDATRPASGSTPAVSRTTRTDGAPASRDAPAATIAGDDGTLLRGAASLIRDTPLRGGAAQLVATAERLDTTTSATGLDRGVARLESARQAAVERIDAAIAASSERTAPGGGAGHTDRDRDGDAVRSAVGPAVVDGRGAEAEEPVEVAAAAGAPHDASRDVDPLATRHEAFRQLRAGIERPSDHAVRAEAADARVAAPTRRPRTVDASRASTAWSADALARAGAPSEVVDATLALSPTDDVQWLAAVARALEPFCGPLPAGPEVVVGPRARRLAPHLAAEVVDADGHPAPGRSVVLPHRRTPDTRRWLTEERGNRGLHMVVGGTAWRDWLFELPDVVSWTRDEDLTDALDTATRFGLVLGWRLGRDAARRATPIDLAVALRARVVGR